MDIEIPPSDDVEGAPRFSDLFEDEPLSDDGTGPDLSIKTFKRPQEFSEEPKPYFKDPEYYKKLLNGEGESAKRVHSILQAYIKAEDAQEKSGYRQRLVPAFWDLAASIAAKIGTKLPDPKMLFLRFGILLPTAIDAEHRQVIASILYRNNTGEPIHYVDDWLREVAYGRVSTSAVDETKGAAKSEGVKLSAQLDKVKGRYDAQVVLINGVVQEMENWERMLLDHAQNLLNHDRSPEYGNLPGPYNETQKASFSEIGDLMRRLSNSNRKLQMAHQEMAGIREQLNDLKAKGEDMPEESTVDAKAVVDEMNTIRQMAKMSVGRQGNHFPMLSKQYFRASLKDIATRENVLNILADLEYLDAGLFLRTFKQQTNRIVPNVILIPCYGDVGICWEPFEKRNRATSRGRIAIPMYPKDLRVAVISACADLRWQTAKEKAQHYWMEEGLTGWYYQWFTDEKLKGDVKDKFIEDYILWLTKESEGTQKLDKAVREIFWRYMTFPQDLKEKLKTRGFVYADLCKKDLNRSMSDGY